MNEAVVIASVPERKIRKDIESGVLSAPIVERAGDKRLCVNWLHLFTLAAVYGGSRFTTLQRRLALSKVNSLTWHAERQNVFVFETTASAYLRLSKAVDGWSKSHFLPEIIELDEVVYLNMKRVFETVRPRADLYAEGLTRVEEVEGVLGGHAVFKNSRLPVIHIGKMYDRGETLKNILDDYPYLTTEDVEFAKLYHLAHPPLGRPRANVGTRDCDEPPPSP